MRVRCCLTQRALDVVVELVLQHEVLAMVWREQDDDELAMLAEMVVFQFHEVMASCRNELPSNEILLGVQDPDHEAILAIGVLASKRVSKHHGVC